MITIEQMTYFLAIEKHKSFSIASHELCISQSSLSKQIKALEIELDTKLFDRNTRNISLTLAGEEFSIYAKKFVNDYENIITNMKKYSNNNSPMLNIGTIPVLTQYGFTSTIAAFKNIHPDIGINIIENENEDILNMLCKSEIDLALLRNLNLPKESLDILPLIDDELVLVTSKDHPLAKKDKISLSDAKDENFILLGARSGIYATCISECEKHGFTPNIVHSMYKIETVLGLVGENLGVTMLMKNVISSFNHSNIAIVSLENPLIASFAIVSNKNKKLSTNEKLFKDFLCKISS